MIIPTAPVQASDLSVGDLILCGVKLREVLAIEPRAEDLETGEPTEYYVTVGGKDRSRRITVTADMSVLIKDRDVGSAEGGGETFPQYLRRVACDYRATAHFASEGNSEESPTAEDYEEAAKRIENAAKILKQGVHSEADLKALAEGLLSR
jgi:hypothetical protein